MPPGRGINKRFFQGKISIRPDIHYPFRLTKMKVFEPFAPLQLLDHYVFHSPVTGKKNIFLCGGDQQNQITRRKKKYQREDCPFVKGYSFYHKNTRRLL